MTEPAITVYGAYWCPDCRRSKQFLSEHQIPYNWVDIEQDKKGEQFVIRANGGKRIIPTIVFEDGSFLVEPSNAELAAQLGLKMAATQSHYDLVIVGGGPAGLLASIFTAREGIHTLVIEKAALGGQAFLTEKLDNMPGFHEGIGGIEFAKRLRQQAERFGVELLQAQEVVGIHSHNNTHAIITGDGSEYNGQALLVSTGSRYRRLGVSGENAYLGAGVHFCASCDGPFYQGKKVAVVGGGNSAAEASLLLAKYANQVTILVRRGEFTASKVLQEQMRAYPKIEVRWHTEVQEFTGKKSRLKLLRLKNSQTNEEAEMAVDGAFIGIGMAPNTGFLNGSGISLDPWRFIVTGHDLVHIGERPPGFEKREPRFLETSVPGIFAAGDVRAGSIKQAPSAAGEGASAAILAHAYLKSV
jgi:thioredoxin reductase (NADPH)